MPTARGTRIGVYAGADADRPTRSMDALVHEIDPGVVSTIHRHSWDAMVLVVAGHGWTEIDGERIDWGPGDSLHLPAWSWHRCGNDSDQVARYVTFSSEPLLETMGMSMLEDAGHTPVSELPPRPPYSAEATGDDPYARRIRRLARDQKARRSGRLHTNWDELELLPTPRGTRTTFLLDRAIGYQASGISMAMFELGPGRGQSMHRHAGRGVAVRAGGHRPQLPRHRTRGRHQPPVEEGRHHRRRPLPVASALQRRSGEDRKGRADPHVRQPSRHHAGADGSDGAVRGATGGTSATRRPATSPRSSGRRSPGRHGRDAHCAPAGGDVRSRAAFGPSRRAVGPHRHPAGGEGATAQPRPSHHAARPCAGHHGRAAARADHPVRPTGNRKDDAGPRPGADRGARRRQARGDHVRRDRPACVSQRAARRKPAQHQPIDDGHHSGARRPAARTPSCSSTKWRASRCADRRHRSARTPSTCTGRPMPCWPVSTPWPPTCRGCCSWRPRTSPTRWTRPSCPGPTWC